MAPPMSHIRSTLSTSTRCVRPPALLDLQHLDHRSDLVASPGHKPETARPYRERSIASAPNDSGTTTPGRCRDDSRGPNARREQRDLALGVVNVEASAPTQIDHRHLTTTDTHRSNPNEGSASSMAGVTLLGRHML